MRFSTKLTAAFLARWAATSEGVALHLPAFEARHEAKLKERIGYFVAVGSVRAEATERLNEVGRLMLMAPTKSARQQVVREFPKHAADPESLSFLIQAALEVDFDQVHKVDDLVGIALRVMSDQGFEVYGQAMELASAREPTLRTRIHARNLHALDQRILNERQSGPGTDTQGADAEARYQAKVRGVQAARKRQKAKQRAKAADIEARRRPQREVSEVRADKAVMAEIKALATTPRPLTFPTGHGFVTVVQADTKWRPVYLRPDGGGALRRGGSYQQALIEAVAFGADIAAGRSPSSRTLAEIERLFRAEAQAVRS